MDELIGYRRLFKQQRHTAESSGIPWRLTFDEYVQIWRPHWAARLRDRLHLNRRGRSGVYEVGNVVIDTIANHVRAQHRRHRAELDVPIPADTNGLWQQVSDFQRDLIEKTLAEYDGSTVLTSAALGISPSSLRYLRKTLNI